MVFVAVEILAVGSKPPAAFVVRISEGGRYDLSTVAPLSTMAPSLEQGSGEGLVQSSPKLVEHIGSGSTRFAEQRSPYIACTAVAALASLGGCGPVCLHGETWLPSVLL